ncbi:MAG: TolC family protein [Alphaproteobacteria bacterium]
MALTVHAAPGHSADLVAELATLLQNHDRIEKAREQLAAAGERVDESYSILYPNLSATTFIGKEDRRNPNANDTFLTGRELNLTLTQRVYDFGASDATIDTSKLRQEQARAVLHQVEEQVLLEALAAYLDIARTAAVVEYASQSVENIQNQTDLENARFERGGGFSTDVLQAQTQLVGAEARLVAAKGDYELAENRFVAVFGYKPTDKPDGDKVSIPPDILPLTVEEAIAVSRDQNSQLIVARFEEAISKKAAYGAEAEVTRPNLDIVGEQIWSKDVEGIQGFRGESVVRLQMTYDIDFGLTLRNTIRAASADYRATQHAYADTVDIVDREVKDAWVQLQTVTRSADLLDRQADLAEQFLELARKERSAGRRSLIDVLAGETALINAQSDAISARLNVKTASLGLLAAMGVLELTSIEP